MLLPVITYTWLNGNRISTYLFNAERDVDAVVETLETELA